MKRNKKSKNGISVIIPTFNRAKYLYPTLICLCNQKNLICNFEVIVIDSGDDDSFEIIQVLKQKYQTNILYKKIGKCRNRSLIRNKGVDFAKYEILCFLDNDILVPSNFINIHYSYHKQNERLVLLQCRRSLTQFNIQQIGEEALINNFSLLENLPWYSDERLETYENKDQWRFVFSHTMSLRYDLFVSAGRFNKKFGEHWGFEDLELGFNLMQKNSKFILIKDCFTYHQPHFSQSNKEQNETRYNKDLFTKLHNYFEVELYSAFYLDYDKFKKNVRNVKDIYREPCFRERFFFSRILGCIYSQNDIKEHRKTQLGVYIPSEKKKYNNTLILSTFFEFDILIKLSIVTEAFRTSYRIFFHKLSDIQKETVIKIGKEAGLLIEIKDKHKYSELYLNGKCNSVFFTLVLPEVYSPEKRYVYTWLCKKLVENNKYVFLSDVHSIKNIEYEDIRIQDFRVINNLFTNYLGSGFFQIIHSTSVYNTQSLFGINNDSNNFIFHDDDFCIDYPSLKFRGTRNCVHYSEKWFANLTFASVYNLVKEADTSKEIEDNSHNYIAFMENGFYEDGIDIILESFSKILQKYPDRKLTIKKPDYDYLFNGVLPWHNQPSRQNKMFQILEKYKSDENRLQQALISFNIQNNVFIISQNMTLFEIIKQIKKHHTLVYMSRGSYVSPQVYIALLYNKEIFAGEHLIFASELKKGIRMIKSTRTQFAEELNVPVSCMNIVYSAFRCSTNHLSEEMLKSSTNVKNKSNNEIYNKIYNEIELAFVEG